MPWKGETDPYKIWLSEIILQQTRVEQGWNYYNRFIETFPNIKKLAKAPQETVFKLWEGLGYYTRCKNLIATAKFIATERQGKFPHTYEDILKLKGVGPYTAAAIGSFAFNLPYAVVDGNVFRVLARFFGMDTPIDSNTGKKMFTALAEDLLDKKKPGIYNQAIMDFGAVVCKPQNPLCGSCPLQTNCNALATGRREVLPVKEGKLVKRTRWFYYIIAGHSGKVYVRKRGAKDIWENLYEFILLEAEKMLSLAELQQTPAFKKIAGKHTIEVLAESKMYRQLLTHQTIHGRFIQIKAKNGLVLADHKEVGPKALFKLPFPKFINSFLAENELKAFER